MRVLTRKNVPWPKYGSIVHVPEVASNDLKNELLVAYAKEVPGKQFSDSESLVMSIVFENIWGTFQICEIDYFTTPSKFFEFIATFCFVF